MATINVHRMGLIAALFIFLWASHALSTDSRRYTRDESEKWLIGKTKEEIVKILGKPDDVTSSTPNDDTWLYKRLLIYDPQTDKTFNRVVIFFSNNRYQRYSLSAN